MRIGELFSKSMGQAFRIGEERCLFCGAACDVDSTSPSDFHSYLIPTAKHPRKKLRRKF